MGLSLVQDIDVVSPTVNILWLSPSTFSTTKSLWATEYNHRSLWCSSTRVIKPHHLSLSILEGWPAYEASFYLTDSTYLYFLVPAKKNKRIQHFLWEGSAKNRQSITAGFPQLLFSMYGTVWNHKLGCQQRVANGTLETMDVGINCSWSSAYLRAHPFMKCTFQRMRGVRMPLTSLLATHSLPDLV